MSYEINTIEELLTHLLELMDKDAQMYNEYTVQEIVDDGISMGIVNPEAAKSIIWAKVL